MEDESPVTIRPPVPRVVQVCVIDADGNFSALLEQRLLAHGTGEAEIVAVYRSIPVDGKNIPPADVVVFDPKHPDFVQVDGIDRVQRLFGEDVVLIARLRDNAYEEELENLEVSGVSIGVRSFDFDSIVLHLNKISLEGVSQKSAKDSGTSITPLRPLPVQVSISIIDANEAFAKSMLGWFNQTLPGIVYIEESFDGIPDPSKVRHLVRAVIFDPEMDDFRRAGPALTRLRQIFGSETLLVAHSDTWKSETPLRTELRGAGVRIGVGRNDFKGFLRLIELLSHQESLELLTREFGT